MNKLVTTSQAWRAIMLLFSLFVFSTASAQQPCDLTVYPSGEVIFESVNGAVVYKVITVTNTSSETQTVNVFLTGADSAALSAFSFEPKTFMLQPSGKKEFKVYFKPNLANLLRYSASLNFSITQGAICTSVELIGAGESSGGGDEKGLIADPGSIKFPATDIGGTVCKEIAIKNASATSAAVISSITIDGSHAFIVDDAPTFPLTLAAGDVVVLKLCYKPLEDAHMYATGKATVSYIMANTGLEKNLHIALSSGANSGGDNIVVISPSQYQFKGGEVGETVCEEFRVVNKSAVKATISNLTFTGDDEFTVESMTTLPVEISAGDSLWIKVCFTPTTAGSDAKGTMSIDYTYDGGITIKHATAVFFAMTEREACVVTSGDDDWKEPILVGGKDDRVLFFSNKTNSAITINEISVVGEDAKAFTITATIPITVAAMSKVEIPFIFAPYAGQNGYLKEKYIAAVVFGLTSEDPASDCKVHEGHIWGYALRDHDDKDSNHSVAISLFPEEKQTIGLSNRGIKESYTLLFKNNLDREIIVQSISMMDGTKFKITSTDPATTPFNLASDATFTVTIEFESADGLLYKDKLIIVSDFAATAIEFDLQGINAAIATVRGMLPEGVSVVVTPNPMRSNTTVDFEGVRSATIEVSDILGSTIMNAVASGDWKWNGRMANGMTAPSGTYFVRIQGESTNGERFVTTQRVVVE